MIVHPTFAVESWGVRERNLDLAVLAQTESVFALSNGHIGLRANLDEGEPHGLYGTYLNAFYEVRPLPYAERGYGYPEAGQTVTATWTINCNEAGASSSVIFNNTAPPVVAGNYASFGPEAYAFNEWGGGVTFAGTARKLQTATVTLFAADGTRLHYISAGESVPLVLVGGRHRVTRRVGPALVAGGARRVGAVPDEGKDLDHRQPEAERHGGARQAQRVPAVPALGPVLVHEAEV